MVNLTIRKLTPDSKTELDILEDGAAFIVTQEGHTVAWEAEEAIRIAEAILQSARRKGVNLGGSQPLPSPDDLAALMGA